ncbi:MULTISPECIES: ABC-F family ATP-binding cassette domain-containing protein [Holospora]|uniref:ABC transporter ATP-binding protein uup-1 n=2 Tax=Holospora TaxID=44747 RepID=A0A061JGN5_9PROT|nr:MULTISPECIES: ABC-F family ATP-binding cassette domain-containing protein [Holospora]ETZ05281.1 ABC transporter ATP-binding protein uup-1 [Holospora undulata HU1]GAJ46641.1 ABC transporter ATP-binding protein uup-1 [Holospora elegans E1]GAJ46844.1 ABC transporter ATP-binding protein uup-1 [Holospora elegans E1]
MNILTLKDAALHVHKKVILSKETVHIYAGEKIALVGRNGCGKSTLLRVLAQELDIEEGVYIPKPGLSIAYLCQNHKNVPECSVETFLHEVLKAPHLAFQAEELLLTLNLDPKQKLSQLSGGELRRAYIARTLLIPSDLIILDEPTNHLDIVGIEWLESWILKSKQAFIIVAHDRKFLKNVTQRTLWLHQGKLRSAPVGFEGFETWQETFLQEQIRIQSRLDVKLAQELRWLARGVTARRRRNEGRLSRLKELRAQKANFSKNQQKMVPSRQDDVGLTRQLMEGWNLGYTLPEGRGLFKELNFRLLKGDRIGIIGPNGCGKSTLIRVLTKEITPSEGILKTASTLHWSMFKQNQPIEELSFSVKRFLCSQGSDYVDVQGKQRHVVAYLKEFLFSPEQAHCLVQMLSGGERNRLRLAKLLSQSPDLLILDEPTNDLDIETLDFLKDFLLQYAGTIIIVSHDRDFLDDVVSSVLVFESQGKVREFVGSFSEYLQAESERHAFFKIPEKSSKPCAEKSSSVEASARSSLKKEKLSYREKFLLENGLQEIEELLDQKRRLEEQLVHFQRNSPLPLNASQIEQLSVMSQTLCECLEKIQEKEEAWINVAEKESRLCSKDEKDCLLRPVLN